MVLLILVQRGKGGGLTGALGGPGGQSAFGTKAGDLFTRITIVAAACWIFLLAFCVWWYTESDFSAALADSDVFSSVPAIEAPAGGAMSGAASSDPGMSVPPTSPTDEATSTVPVVPSESAPAGETAKPNAEVEASDLPATTDAPAKTEEKSNPEPTGTADPSPSEPASTEPKPDASEIPTPEKS